MTTIKRRSEAGRWTPSSKEWPKNSDHRIRCLSGRVIFAVVQKTAQPWWLLPVSVLGGLLGLLNFRWLAIAVQRVYLRQVQRRRGSNIATVIISLLETSRSISIIPSSSSSGSYSRSSRLVGFACFRAILWAGVNDDTQTPMAGNSKPRSEKFES